MIEVDQPEQSAEKSVRIGGRRITLRRAADQLPTKWFGTFAAVVFLMLTAAFGGLRTAPPTTIADVAVGETYTNDEVSIAVERLLVADSVDEIYTAADQKVVVLVTTITNRWNRPLALSFDLGKAVRVATRSADATDPDMANVEVLPTPDMSPGFTRTDDGTLASPLQPGVPVPMAWTWTVDATTARNIADATEVIVWIDDQTVIETVYVTAGFSWGDPTPGARVVVQPETRASLSVTDLDADRAVAPTDEEGG